MSSNSIRSTGYVPIIIIALLIASIFGAAMFRMRTDAGPVSANVATVQTSAADGRGSKDNPYVVSLTRDQSEPIDLLVNVGDYVQFNSADGSEHQIIQGKPSADHGHDEYANAVHGVEHGTTTAPLDSGVFKADEGYLLQLKDIGKFEFHDNFNHEYGITIIVYDKDKKQEDTRVE